MKIGTSILEIRKTKNMTQEEFAGLFHVTRQTVSNWENEKSYPDLQTLVDISEKFDVSLDKMLKEDIAMVKKMDKDMRIGGYLKKGLIFFGCILVVVVISWLIFWSSNKNEVEEKFQIGIEECGFHYDAQLGYYTKDKGENIKFTLPNQRMPSPLDFVLDFHAKHLDCYIETEDGPLWLRWSELENLSIILNGEQLSSSEKDRFIEDNSVFWEVISEGEDIYKSVYK